MSKVMQRELTVTTCKVAKTVIGEGGFPALEPMEDQTIIGAVTQAQADKIIKERLAKIAANGVYGKEGSQEELAKVIDGIVVFGLESTTAVYELPLETFFKYANVQIQLTDEEKAAKRKADAIASAEKAVSRAKELQEKAAKKVTDLDNEISNVTATIASGIGGSEDVKKLEDKLSTLHERKLKADTKLDERNKDVAAAEKALAKSQK